VLLVALVIPAALIDFRQRRVPNWLALAGVLSGVGLNSFLYQTGGLWLSLKGIGLAMAVYFPLYLLRGMGAGDVKLMAAVGAVAGPANWLGIFVMTAVIGGVVGLVVVIVKERLSETFENILAIMGNLGARKAPYRGNPQLDVRTESGIRLPHAVIIAFGTLTFLIVAARPEFW